MITFNKKHQYKVVRGYQWESLYVDGKWVTAAHRLGHQQFLDILRELGHEASYEENQPSSTTGDYIKNCWCAKCNRFSLNFYNGPAPGSDVWDNKHIKCDGCGYEGYSYLMDDGTDYWFVDENNVRTKKEKVKQQ
jgi:hypothetical protein